MHVNISIILSNILYNIIFKIVKNNFHLMLSDIFKMLSFCCVTSFFKCELVYVFGIWGNDINIMWNVTHSMYTQCGLFPNHFKHVNAYK